MVTMRVLLLATLLWVYAAAQDDGPNNTTDPVSSYISRPDLHPPALNVSIQDGYAPGYVSICPYFFEQRGPYLFDKGGNLVWSGYNATEDEEEDNYNTHAMRVCSYNGSDHLCLWKGLQNGGWGFGHSIILNSNYELVKTFNTGNGAPENDFHESYLINNGATALLIAYNTIEYDLTPVNVTATPSWLLEGMFQEVNVSSGEVLFEWHSTDHVDLTASVSLPEGEDGTSEEEAWDYFHMNSVDKSERGNYLISVRHTSAIYHINGTDGEVIWTLSSTGNPNNTFQFDNFNFSYQHDAHFISENATHTIISLFDNASNGNDDTSSQSSGMIISLDLESNTATLIQQTFFPQPGGVLAGSQGNYQVLEDGGTFIGWGPVTAASETNAAGDPVFFAQWGQRMWNYRAYTFNWTGQPLSPPALVIPPQLENAATPFIAYFSWNGGTEVKQWRLWGSVNNVTGFKTLDTVDKEGFETRWTSENYTAFVFVEALGGEEESLGNSSVVGVGKLRSNGTVEMPTPQVVLETPSPSPTQEPSASPTGKSAQPTGSATATATATGTGIGAAMGGKGDVMAKVCMAVALGAVSVAFGAL
ncbi:hypothetical protein K458DRAFT_398108 [Lentithecium fluviatile CBS 122367]|uniref:ASST-domain-containing protein n=1 Tax=Lentithecium fluviatile CBS 122367 TaxID=1168545 RepID=A0A6G1JM86_9PLEO|nr:hypothetical protein K458DRAFT_398108 [Lentithecium fluviatile CBS 122367]